jgi:DME family drug/metabolite transporter
MKFKGYALVALAALFWGLIGPLSKIAFSSGVGTVETAFYRTTFCWLFFGAHALALGQLRIALRDLPIVLAFGLAGVGGLFGFYVLAVREGGAALAAVLLYTAPAWVALMSWLVLGESMGRAKLASVGLTILGVGCISLGPSLSGVSLNGAALGFGLLSGFSYALYYIFGKRYLGRYASPTLFLYALPVGAAAMVPFCEFSGHSPGAWLVLLALAFLSTYLAYFVYYVGLKDLEATRAAVVATLEPVAAGVLAYMLFGEAFDTLGYAGAALILGSVLLTVWDGRRMQRAATREALGHDFMDRVD